MRVVTIRLQFLFSTTRTRAFINTYLLLLLFSINVACLKIKNRWTAETNEVHLEFQHSTFVFSPQTVSVLEGWHKKISSRWNIKSRIASTPYTYASTTGRMEIFAVASDSANSQAWNAVNKERKEKKNERIAMLLICVFQFRSKQNKNTWNLYSICLSIYD